MRGYPAIRLNNVGFLYECIVWQRVRWIQIRKELILINNVDIFGDFLVMLFFNHLPGGSGLRILVIPTGHTAPRQFSRYTVLQRQKFLAYYLVTLYIRRH
jgi:hypothetical protein